MGCPKHDTPESSQEEETETPHRPRSDHSYYAAFVFLLVAPDDTPDRSKLEASYLGSRLRLPSSLAGA